MYNDNEIRMYKPSGRFSPVGAVLLTITTFMMLSLLFIPYLWLVRICPIVYINIFLAVLVSVAAGIVGGLITKMYKMRNVTVTTVCVIIAFLGATYVKWSMYDYFDQTVVIKKAMQEYNAYEYYGLGDIFSEDEEEVDADALIEYYLTTDEWKEYEFDKLLGSSVSEVKLSLESARTTDAYSFTYATGKYEEADFISIFSHPSGLWKDIKNINKVGRWKIGSGDYGENTHGIFLWLTWFGEFVLLGVVLLAISLDKSKKPFIETDNEWAEEGHFSDQLKFAPCSDNTDELKYILMTDQNRFFQQKYSLMDTPQIYIGIDLFMSRDRNENYISAYLYTYVEKNKNYSRKEIVQYAYCDRDLCLYLLNLVGKV